MHTTLIYAKLFNTKLFTSLKFLHTADSLVLSCSMTDFSLVLHRMPKNLFVLPTSFNDGVHCIFLQLCIFHFLLFSLLFSSLLKHQMHFCNFQTRIMPIHAFHIDA